MVVWAYVKEKEQYTNNENITPWFLLPSFTVGIVYLCTFCILPSYYFVCSQVSLCSLHFPSTDPWQWNSFFVNIHWPLWLPRCKLCALVFIVLLFYFYHVCTQWCNLHRKLLLWEFTFSVSHPEVISQFYLYLRTPLILSSDLHLTVIHLQSASCHYCQLLHSVENSMTFPLSIIERPCYVPGEWKWISWRY